MPEPVIGLIGCGFIGRFHSRNLRLALRTELVPGEYPAVCDRVFGRAESFAGITGARVVAENAEQVFSTPGINAIYVCTETAEHPSLVQRAASLGLHVFCEKPLARTLDEVEMMVEAVESAGVTNQVGLVLRYSPIYTVLKEMISDPALGPFLTAHLRDDQYFPTTGQYGSQWRGDFERAGGGTLIEHSIHDVDLFQWLFGPVTSVRCRTRYSSGHDRVEDLALVTFEHEGGHTTTLSSIWHAIGDRPSTRRLEVFFEGGYFATDDDFIGPITVQLRSGEAREIPADEVLARYRQLASLTEAEMELATRGALEDFRFLEAVHQGRPSFPNFRTALSAHRVVDACYRSAQGSAEVSVEKL